MTETKPKSESPSAGEKPREREIDERGRYCDKIVRNRPCRLDDGHSGACRTGAELRLDAMLREA